MSGLARRGDGNFDDARLTSRAGDAPAPRPSQEPVSASEISGISADPPPTLGVTVGDVRRAVVRSVAGMAVYYLWPWAAAVVFGWATNPFLGVAVLVAVMGYRAIREGVTSRRTGAEVERRGDRSPEARS